MIYDVFMSFRGEDSGRKFTSELARALSNMGLMTLMDDKRFKNGDKFGHQLEIIIENSRCFIVVLSKGYVTSTWCLRELATIMDCMVETRRQVIPVFYHVDPSSVQHQVGVLKQSLDEHQPTDPMVLTTQYFEEVQRWRDAMTKITNLSAVFIVTNGSHELDIIKKITLQIFYPAFCKLVAPDRYKNLVGMSLRLHQMHVLLDLESDDVRFVGIVGMDGIGKTTIAEVLYDTLSPKFRYNSCFLRVSIHNLVLLQYQLLSRLLWKEKIIVKNENHGAQLIKNRLSGRKVLIILDGVDEGRKLEKLVGSRDWFSPGSRIILTTRNRNVSRQPTYKDKILDYNVELLDHDSAFSLFCKHAFRNEPPDENFRYLAEEMVKKVEGHPSALINIGSYLYGQDIDIWEENLKSVHKLVYKDLFSDILKTSYEGLDVDSQQIFLDLACFFNGMSVNRVIEILMGFGYNSPYSKIKLLADKNLIEISYEKIQMHILILCMGRGIARGEIATQQDKQSRIWLREDIRRLFHEKNGLKYIQGIVMDVEEEELKLEANLFTCMTALKILDTSNVQLSEDIKFLSNQLRLLNWPGYPSKYLPSTFQPPSLLELHLRNSEVVQLWEGKKAFVCLKEIDVSGSEYLVETPDFSNVPNLQRLILRNCVRLCVVHPSINGLGRLVLVDMEGCVGLTSFQSNMISCKSLETLILSNSGLECFPEIEGYMKSLTELHLDGTVINDLPFSIGHLSSLAVLNLRDCTELSTLPRVIRRLMSLKTLNLNSCKTLHQIPLSLGKIESLEVLDIGGTSIDDAPFAIGSLWNLETLNCERLSRNIWHSLTALFGNVWSIRDLNLSDCNLVDEDIPEDLHSFSLLEILDLSRNHFVLLAESLSQLINLKALYLNDCIKLQRLPKLPASLQYLGGEKSWDMSRNSEGSSRSTSSSSPSNPPLMTKVENLSDVAKEEYSPQVDIVNKTGKQIFNSKLVVSGQNLVGMKDQLEKVYNLLDLKASNAVLFVGIFGMAGIGKTSIAEVLYDTIADGFESSCFLRISEQSNLVSLQHLLLSQLLLKEDIKVQDEDYRAQMIENHMSSKKVLIVLDGVDEKTQIEKLVGTPDWFSPGSRIIITTRNKEILRQPNYKDKMKEYHVELLCHESAYLLFRKHAFGDDPPDKKELCNEIIEKVGRLPLALRIIGSFLHNKDLAIWEQTLMRLGKVEDDFFGTISKKKNQMNYTMKAINCPTEVSSTKF